MTQNFETIETPDLPDASSSKKRTTRQKAMAILAAGLVLGVGTTVTLAVWNDSEWVVGGAADANGGPGTPGVGTGVFEVQQNVSSPFSAAGWLDNEGNPGESLVFTAGALELTPGDAIYAPVSLSTTEDSAEAPSVTLAGAIDSAGIPFNDPDGALADALGLRVTVTTTARNVAPAVCSAASFAAGSTYVVGSAAGAADLDAAGVVVSSLAEESGNQLNYCFEITLPDGASDDLQGLTLAPAWQFVSASELD